VVSIAIVVVVHSVDHSDLMFCKESGCEFGFVIHAEFERNRMAPYNEPL
jgi:hypothetical protein